MVDSSKQARIEELLRKSLLGEELVNTQFHLYSARSSASGRVFKPRVLCANNILLAKNSKFFVDLLSTDINPSDPLDPSLVDLTDHDDVSSDARMDDYGYGSDSDLEDCSDPVHVTNPKAEATQNRFLSTSKSKSKDNDDDDGESDDGSSVSSDMFVMTRSSDEPREDSPIPFSGDKTRIKDRSSGSIADGKTAVQSPEGNGSTLESDAAMRLRSLGSRHILVKDTAFQTWYTLLNYLYTDKCSFMPLSSSVVTQSGQVRVSSTSAVDEPRCSAKSMYRLASKVGLDDLRDTAFAYIRRNLTEQNILQELSSSLVSTHPKLREMELDVLYSHIASPVVVTGFPDLARRIANKELKHGADIVVGIHTRLLKARSETRTASTPRSSVKPDNRASDAPTPAKEGTAQSPAAPPVPGVSSFINNITSPSGTPCAPPSVNAGIFSLNKGPFGRSNNHQAPSAVSFSWDANFKW